MSLLPAVSTSAEVVSVGMNPDPSKSRKSRRTRAEASARNAQKWNARQRAALPLFVQAGLEDHLVQVEVTKAGYLDANFGGA